ncbi:hypothetical protein B5S32_g3274 [[Candida] boidinii]|nr:hypothetical protein B5S29_g3205 [[Candida] boidinii]OWB79064.1 hypothetical protein B5S32_g3274 [[Candida] boidinii]GME86000.1 unnamed protein product [[Candida] boidinii]
MSQAQQQTRHVQQQQQQQSQQLQSIPHDSLPRPRFLTDAEKARIEPFREKFYYSSRYNDGKYEYRHVLLPREMLKLIPTEYFVPETGTFRILLEDEWRGLGIQQSLGWAHYETHAPEPNVLLFRRDK